MSSQTSSGDGAGDLVEISEEELHLGKYVDAVRSPAAGAIATFSGTTRDSFEGRQVVELRYEAYLDMAEAKLRKICRDARGMWNLIKVALAHRIGIVPVGEESVIVAISSAHRKDALEACQFAIDEIKATVPIWKKEVYDNGEVWKENVEFLGQLKDGPLSAKATSPPIHRRHDCCKKERSLASA